MSAPGVWGDKMGLIGGNSDGDVLRPSAEFWKHHSAMMNGSADAERAIHEAAFPPELEGMAAAEAYEATRQRDSWVPRGHTDRKPQATRNDDMEVFHSVFFDED